MHFSLEKISWEDEAIPSIAHFVFVSRLSSSVSRSHSPGIFFSRKKDRKKKFEKPQMTDKKKINLARNEKVIILQAPNARKKPIGGATFLPSFLTVYITQSRVIRHRL